MRALRYSYTFPSGYVQKYPLLDATTDGSGGGGGGGIVNSSILWGLATAASGPTATEIATFTQIDATTYKGISITFPSGQNKHLCICIPVLFTPPDYLYYNSFPVRFTQTTQAIVINNLSKQYQIYTSQFQQTGTNILVKLDNS